MGGNKFRFVLKRRCNERHQYSGTSSELRVSIPVKHMVDLPSMLVSLPISAYFDSPIDTCNTLCSRMSAFPLPPGWVVHSFTPPLTICKLQTTSHRPPRVCSVITLSIGEDMKCEWTFIHHNLDTSNCLIFGELPTTISSTTSVGYALTLVDTCTQCIGNPDPSLVDVFRQRSLTIHGNSGT